MIEENAVVTSVEAGIAEVEVVRRTTCGACSAKAGCGVSLLDRMLGRRPQRLLVTDALGSRAGDAVIIGIPEGALLSAAFTAYMIPLLGLIGGAIFGELLFAGSDGGSGASLLTGAIGFVLALTLTRCYSRRLSHNRRWRAVLLRRDTAAGQVTVAIPTPR